MSEFDFIERIQRKIKVRKGEINVGIGDDCAFIKNGNNLLITVDSQVENIHFKLSWGRPELLGRKLVRINMSDIYAKGGNPEYALLSIGVDYKNKKGYINTYINGVIKELEDNNIQLIGGNVSSVKKGIFFDLVMIGVVKEAKFRYRGGAKIGDYIAVSGMLGDASAGVKILEYFGPISKSYERLVNAFYGPEVYYYGDKKIWNYVNASIDISDGLIGDLSHILKSSNCGALIDLDKIPISSELRKFCGEKGLDINYFALSGGEDYRLLVTLKENTPKSVILESGFTIIGKIVKQRGIRIKGIKKSYSSFKHF
ncbi:MAG: thiamine-phosphate kinase [Deltaproteobacteria bacterium]|nr:thiamine-phosphate kinase [Deltaproteobacteria bacterium]